MRNFLNILAEILSNIPRFGTNHIQVWIRNSLLHHATFLGEFSPMPLTIIAAHLLYQNQFNICKKTKVYLKNTPLVTI